MKESVLSLNEKTLVGTNQKGHRTFFPVVSVMFDRRLVFLWKKPKQQFEG